MKADKSVFEQIFGISGREFFGVTDSPSKEPAKGALKRYRVRTAGGKVVVTGHPKEIEVNGTVVWKAPVVTK